MMVWNSFCRASSSSSAVSRRRMSSRCSSESATCFVVNERSSRFLSGVPDSARRKIARYFSLSSSVIRPNGSRNVDRTSPLDAT